MAHRKAHPHLRRFVKGYVTSASILPTPVRERHLPSTEVPLLVNLGAAHRHIDPAQPGRSTSRDGAWIVGLQGTYQLTEAAGERDFLIVRFTPLGAHLFLRAPMHLISGQALDLRDIDPALAAAVIDRVGAAQSWLERFSRIEALIAERLLDATPPSGLSFAWRKLESTGGRIPLSSLMAEIDCSHRTLIAQFRACVGRTPKAAGRLFRFNRVVASLNELVRRADDELTAKPFIESQALGIGRVQVNWADIAADCGYFDQSHFITEFKKFAGSTPAEFIGRISHVA